MSTDGRLGALLTITEGQVFFFRPSGLFQFQINFWEQRSFVHIAELVARRIGHTKNNENMDKYPYLEWDSNP
jgi:hypothetical protein